MGGFIYRCLPTSLSHGSRISMVYGRGGGAAFHSSIYFVLSSVVALANVSEVAWSQGVGEPGIIWRCLQVLRNQGSRSSIVYGWRAFVLVSSNIYVNLYFVSCS